MRNLRRQEKEFCPWGEACRSPSSAQKSFAPVAVKSDDDEDDDMCGSGDGFVTDLRLLDTRLIGKSWNFYLHRETRERSREWCWFYQQLSSRFTVATNKWFTVAKQIHLCTGDRVEHQEEQLPDDQRSEPDRRRCSWSERKHKNTWRRTWKRPGHVWSSQSSQSVRDYCQENIIDINNNILDFKDAVREVNGKINKKILGCGKNIETCRSEWIHFSEEIKPVTIADLNMANDLWLAWK